VGGCKLGENSKNCARRELREETRNTIRANHLNHLFHFMSTRRSRSEKVIKYTNKFKGDEYTFQLAQDLLLNHCHLSDDHRFQSNVKKCVELLRKLPDPEGNVKNYANFLECCTRPESPKRSSTAPNYDAQSILINGETPGLSYSTWKGSNINSVSDIHGPIDKKYWGKAIQEYGDIMNYIKNN